MSGFANLGLFLVRLTLAAIVLFEVMQHYHVENGILVFHAILPGNYFFEVLQHGGAAVAAIWLTFGIQARMAGAVGAIFHLICERAEYLAGFAPEMDVVAIGLPLLLGALILAFGGGRWVLYGDRYHSLL